MFRPNSGRSWGIRLAIAIAVGCTVSYLLIVTTLVAALRVFAPQGLPTKIGIGVALVISMVAAGYVTAWISGRRYILSAVCMLIVLSLLAAVASRGQSVIEIGEGPGWIVALVSVIAGGWLRRLIEPWKRQQAGPTSSL
jgi:hypothetical protein